MSIIFIEGPDEANRTLLYEGLANINCKFYDIADIISEYQKCGLEPDILALCVKTRILTILEIANYHDMNFVINGGPLKLICDAFDANDQPTLISSSEILSSIHYKNVTIISILSKKATQEKIDSYRRVSSVFRSGLTNIGTNNKYKAFFISDDLQSHVKVLANDIRILINN